MSAEVWKDDLEVKTAIFIPKIRRWANEYGRKQLLN